MRRKKNNSLNPKVFDLFVSPGAGDDVCAEVAADPGLRAELEEIQSIGALLAEHRELMALARELAPPPELLDELVMLAMNVEARENDLLSPSALVEAQGRVAAGSTETLGAAILMILVAENYLPDQLGARMRITRERLFARADQAQREEIGKMLASLGLDDLGAEMVGVQPPPPEKTLAILAHRPQVEWLKVRATIASVARKLFRNGAKDADEVTHDALLRTAQWSFRHGGPELAEVLRMARVIARGCARDSVRKSVSPKVGDNSSAFLGLSVELAALPAGSCAAMFAALLHIEPRVVARTLCINDQSARRARLHVRRRLAERSEATQPTHSEAISALEHGALELTCAALGVDVPRSRRDPAPPVRQRRRRTATKS